MSHTLQEVYRGALSILEGEPRKEKNKKGPRGYRFSTVIMTATSLLYIKYFRVFDRTIYLENKNLEMT